MTTIMRAFFTLLLLSIGCAGSDRPPANRAQFEVGSLESVVGFGANPAQLKMFIYVPAGMPASPRPLVVALHGCSQTAAAYQIAGWNEMAELWKFYVLYPEQNSAVNNSLGCFNWGASWDGAPSTMVSAAPLHLEDLSRGHAENQSIIEMVDHMKSSFAIDANRVYASGVSAGGGFTAVLLATWPDVFAGGAIIAGVPYGCTIVDNATSEHGKACVKSHPEGDELNRTAQEWGDLVRGAYPGYPGPYPKVSIWHGSADWVVSPGLVTELVEQWTNVHGIDMDADATGQAGPAEHVEYRDGSGQTLVESYVINGMGHGQPVDPTRTCGSAGMFFNDVGICAASVAGELFGLDQIDGENPPDPTAPRVNVTSPPSGSIVAGTVQIEASATDPDGITRVDFYLDGEFFASSSASPYAADWQASGAAPGEHRIRAEAYDGTGARGIDDDTSVFVNRGDDGDGGGNSADAPAGACQSSTDSRGALTLALLAVLVLGFLRVRRRT